jgi:hypothetical protein
MNRICEKPVNFEQLIEANILPANSSILNNLRDPVNTTERYKETDDIGVVQILNDNNWFIDIYKQVNPRNPEMGIYKQYMATYKNKTLPQLENEGEITVIQRGSKDGSKKFRFDVGFFKWSTMSGLIVGNKVFKTIEIKHIGKTPDQLGKILEQVEQAVPQIFKYIEKLNSVTLSENQKKCIAKEAIALRFPEDKNGVTVDAVLTPRHYESNNNSLWNVLNILNENLLKGGTFTYTTKNNRVRRSRAVKNIDLEYNISIGLWLLAEKYLN